MRYEKKSLDYQLNMEAFHDMDDHVPMTKPERDALRSRAKKGYDIDTNPWGLTEPDGYPMNYLKAYRIKNGYSSGPWDDWKGDENQLFWDKPRLSFFSYEDPEID